MRISGKNTAGLAGRVITVGFTCLMISFMVAALPTTVAGASKFNVGDTVEVTANLNVRMGPSTSNPEITDPDYPGYAPAGTQGTVLDGPVSADGYVWYEVDYGQYSGWSIEGGLEKVVQPPPVPTITSPGSSTEPGPVIDTVTPTLQWSAVSEADYYALAISVYPYGSGNIIYNPQQVTGTSHTVPSGELEAGKKYRWNMQAHNSAGWSDVSNTLYFQTAVDDTMDPTVDSLSVTPSLVSQGDSFTISYSVFDTGGSGLNRVELWRADDSNGSPVNWVEITRTPASGSSDSGSFTDAPSSPGFYWYGIHVADNTGNWATEDSPVRREVVGTGITLTLYVHERSESGPVIPGVKVTGQDAVGTSFDKTTNASGYVTITGTLGTWNFTASKAGYNTNSWSQSITATTTKHAYLEPEVTVPSQAPVHIFPSNGASDVSLTPTFQWQAVSGATKYGLYVSKPPYGEANLVFDSEVDYGPITGTSFTLPITLEEEVTYHWNMRAGNNAGWGPFSSASSFTTPCTMPGRDTPEKAPDFFDGLLSRLNIPVTEFASGALRIWTQYENTGACWNPLATTWDMQDKSSDFNAAGVKNYIDEDTGIAATANTLSLSYYEAIRRMLAMQSFDEEPIRQAVATWSGLRPSDTYVTNLVHEWERLYPVGESKHPYDNNFVYTWTIWTSGPAKVRLHFQKIELALNDCIYILDNDRELACYRGNNQGTDLKTIYEDEWTDWFCVDNLKVKFETNSSYTAYGFKIDRIETRPCTKYVLDIDVSGQGSTDPSPGSHTYDEGAEVTITATPDDPENWHFDHWEGAATIGWSESQCQQNPVTIAMGSDRSVIACFELEPGPPPPEPEPENVVFESKHPYDNDFVYTWTIWESGPTEVRLHFHKIELALNDCIYILDNDRELACYRGIDFKTTWADHWTEWFTVSPHTLQVELDTNNDYAAWGFLIDKLEVKPKAKINSISPSRVEVGRVGEEVISFRGDGTDPDGSVEAYEWRSSIDGQLSTSSSFTAPESDLSEGTHTIYLKVRDNEGNWSEEVIGTVTMEPNEPPIASIDSISPTRIIEGEEVSFSGSGTDTEGTVVAYEWRSSIDGPLPNSKSFTTSSLSEGTHTISFKVGDNHGDWSLGVSGTVAVKPNEPPIASIDSISPTRIIEGEEVSFSGSGTDSNGTVVAYEWTSSIDGQLSTSKSFTTSGLSEGIHTIYFKVRDNDGAWSEEVSSTVTGGPPPPPIAPIASIESISPNRIIEGEEVSFSGSGTDSDGTVVAYEWTSDIDGRLSTSKSFTTSSLSDGTHTICFKVRDNDGNWSPEVSGTVTMEPNEPPIANIDSISPNRIRVGEEVSFSGNSTDYDGTVVAYEWMSDIDGQLSTSNSFNTSSLSEGTHTICFKVKDNHGDWSLGVSGTVIVDHMPDFEIHVNRDDVKVGEDVIVLVSVGNPKKSLGDMETDITISIPSGWSIIEWGFFQSVGGLQSYTCIIEPGRDKSANICLRANKSGKVKITGNVEYWFTDESGKPITKAVRLTESVDVTAAIYLTIETNGQGTTDPNPGTHRCDKDEEVTITAIPDPEWYFNQWEGEVPRTSSRSVTINMNTSKKITACFSPESPPPRPPLYLTILIIIGSLILVAGVSMLVIRRSRRRST